MTATTRQPARTVDVAIVGAGSAGLRAYRAAVAHTDNVVLIEGSAYGTTCARMGCMPSKLLIAAAEAAHAAQHAGPFGVRAEVRVDGAAVMQRVRDERDRFVGFVVEDSEALPARHRIWGKARFEDDHTLLVEHEGTTQRVVADRIVLAVGSRPTVLPFLRGLGDRLIVNDDVFSWQDLPERVIVFGPGVIGLELGQALSRLGVQVTLFGVGGFVGPLSDPELLQTAREVFGSELNLHSDADVVSVERTEHGVSVTHRVEGELHVVNAQYVLSATGRTSNLDRLNLDATHLPRTERGGLPVHQGTLQVADSHVFVAGDATGERPLLHEAAHEGSIAGRNAAQFPHVTADERKTSMGVVFSEPQILTVGSRHRDLTPGSFVTGAVSWTNQGRSRVLRRNHGAMHVYIDRHSGRLLGAEGLGPQAEHLAHLLAWTHQLGLTASQVLDLPFYHPVVEEGLRTALQRAEAQRQQLAIAA